MRKFILIPFLFCFLITLTFAQAPTLTHTVFATGLNRPIDIANCGDERLFVIEQDGYIRIIDNSGTVRTTPFLDIDSRIINSGNERGLLGLAFHPDYKNNGYFYVNYSNNSGNSVIARYSVSTTDSNVANVNSEVQLLTFTQPFSNHNGGCMKFGPDGYLYIGSGDGGSGGDPQGNGQKKNTYLGKMLRIDVDNGLPYAIPADNPFVNDPAYFGEIWATGIRNPWRFSFDRITGDLWIGDVGQNALEEIDFQPGTSRGGENYGWRCYEASQTYNTSGCGPANQFTYPVFEYSNNGSVGCSVTGGFVYRGGVHNDLYGYYIHADFCSGRFWVTIPDGLGGWTTTDLGTQSGSPASLGEDVYGELYWADLSGTIYKIGMAGCAPTAAISGGSSYCSGDSITLSTPFNPDLVYEWYFNGAVMPGVTGNTYKTATVGDYFVRVTNSNMCTTDSDTLTLTMDTPPTVTLGGLMSNYCTVDAAVTLSGTPSGGWFSGPGVIDSMFDPANAGPGAHLIAYTYMQGACTVTDTQSVIVDICQGTENAWATAAPVIAPNPNNGSMEVRFSTEETQEIALRILDMQGRVVYTRQPRTAQPGEQSWKVNLENLPVGNYLLQMRGSNKSFYAKFQIQR